MKVFNFMAKDNLRLISYITISSFLITFFASCENSMSKEEDLLDFPETIEIEGGFIQQSKMINQVFSLTLLKNYLIVGDPKENFLFTLFDLESEATTFQFGKIGDGPCEFKFPTSVQILSPEDQILGFYSRSNWKYQKGQFKLLDNSLSFDCIEAASKPFDPNYQMLISVSDSLFMGTGIFPFKYGVSYINTGKTDYLKFSYPFVGEKNQNGEVAMSQQGEISKQPSGDRILVTSKYSPFFDILEYRDRGFFLLNRMEGGAR